MTTLYERDAWLYDLAFAGDVTNEVELLLERLGDVERTLEVACGSGRYLPALADRGVRPVGLDRSATMLARAHERLAAAGHPDAELVAADMRDFHLSAPVDGAFCAVNTLGYLTTDDEVAAHLAAVAANLVPRGRYLVQLDLYAPGERAEDYGSQAWESEHDDGTTTRFTWSLDELDTDAARAVYTSHVEVLTGRHAGVSATHEHVMRAWTWRCWCASVSDSGFEQIAAHDGDADGWPRIPLEALDHGAHLVWHELVRR